MLHIADPTIGHAGLQLLSALWHAAGDDAHLLILGHHDGVAAAAMAGIPSGNISWHRSLGRFDPATFRGMARAVRLRQPQAVGLWGNWAQHAGRAAAHHVPLCIDFIPPSQPYLPPAFYSNWFVSGRRAAVGFDRGEALVCGSTPLRYCVQGWCGKLPLQEFDTAAAASAVEFRARSATEDSAGGGTGENHGGSRRRDGATILIIADAGPATRVDIAVWAAAIVEQIRPDIQVQMVLPAGYWGVDRERRRRILEFIGDLADPGLVSVVPEGTKWCKLAAKADICLLAADGPVILAPLLSATAMGTPAVATATTQIQSAQPLSGLAATAPPNDPRLLAAAVLKVLSEETVAAREERATHALRECLDRSQHLHALLRGLRATEFSAAHGNGR